MDRSVEFAIGAAVLAADDAKLAPLINRFLLLVVLTVQKISLNWHKSYRTFSHIIAREY